MGRISKANLKKTIYYLKRNGLEETWYAVRERLEEKRQPPYVWTPPSGAELAAQRRQWKERGFTVTFSILVPAYRTRAEYLRELLASLSAQTYPKWELILADATEDDSVERIIQGSLDAGGNASVPGDCPFYCPDSRIRYIRLGQNAGISGNTNRALPYAAGDYVGLLDHDDILAPNALYEMAAAIEEGKRQGGKPRMLYSDEDKCNGDRTQYSEPNRKEDFNLDLLLSNNYICHFLVMERGLIQKLKFRQEFDGAQDYDLVLRAAAELGALKEPGTDRESPMPAKVVHIPEILYHWRCHIGSTAENPESKLYAYEAGRRALQDFADRAGWHARATDTAHVGFYTLRYEGSPFDSRQDIGAIGGRLVHRRRTCGGRMAEDGRIIYENLPSHYSGYLHRAALPQDAEAADLRNIQISPRCRELFRQVTGVACQTIPETDIFDVSRLPEGCDIHQMSLALSRALREAGYRILYLPERTRRV